MHENHKYQDSHYDVCSNTTAFYCSSAHTKNVGLKLFVYTSLTFPNDKKWIVFSTTTEFYFHFLSCKRGVHRQGWVWWRVCQRLHKPHSQWCVDQ